VVKILFIREILVLVHGQLEGASYRTESGQTPILWQSSSSRERGRRRGRSFAGLSPSNWSTSLSRAVTISS